MTGHAEFQLCAGAVLVRIILPMPGGAVTGCGQAGILQEIDQRARYFFHLYQLGFADRPIDQIFLFGPFSPDCGSLSRSGGEDPGSDWLTGKSNRSLLEKS